MGVPSYVGTRRAKETTCTPVSRQCQSSSFWNKGHSSISDTQADHQQPLDSDRSEVRLSDIWFAYLNKFKDAEEMLASQAGRVAESMSVSWFVGFARR